jgi:succinate-semialdehyde dehydrogenase/glutarate-semialdehyde dehydrogenase
MNGLFTSDNRKFQDSVPCPFIAEGIQSRSVLEGSDTRMLMRIGGKEVEGIDETWIDVKNPATSEFIDHVPAGTKEEVTLATEAAENAFPPWAKKSMRDRGKILFQASQMVRDQYKDLARLLTLEQGKPLRESTDEVREFANILEFYAGVSACQNGEVIQLGIAGDCMVIHQPLGVCGSIIPWNMPVLIMGWKIGPALLAGNTMVLKPASATPLTNLQLGRILEEGGLPPGVLNIVTGSGESVGMAMAKNTSIRKLSFTGDYETGCRIREIAGSSPKEITLELGGSDPMIVMQDADIDKAVDGALRARFYNAGQTCTAVKRLYIHEKIAVAFIKKLKERVEALTVGNGLGSKVDIGPMNSERQREKISRRIEEARNNREGTILTGGHSLKGTVYEKGYFYRPTLVTDVMPGSGLLTDEIFGPVLPIMTVPDLDCAIREANNTRFGLGASVWTKDLSIARRVFSEVNAGIIWVNRHLTVPPEVPFGGMSASGTGRENGQHALDGYSQTKTLYLGW